MALAFNLMVEIAKKITPPRAAAPHEYQQSKQGSERATTSA
jgi:hypothetical protein